MLKHLKNRLVLLFTLTTSLIVTIVILTACFLNLKQLQAHNIEVIENQLDSIVYKLKNDNVIQNTWLAEMEAANHLIISISDNGSPFFFKGSWLDSHTRSLYIRQAEALAKGKGADITKAPLSMEEIRCPVFSLKGKDGINFIGTAAILPLKSQYKSILLLQYFPQVKFHTIRLILLFFVAEILSVAALFFASRILIGAAVKPVEENQQKQKEFIAAASHELRSPLAVIQSSATALLTGSAQIERFVPRIEAECKRMARLIEDMLTLASSDAKTWSLKKESLDVDTLLIEIYDTYTPLCKKKQQNLAFQLPEDPLPPLLADQQRFLQILSILLDNALSYSPPLTNIILRAYTEEGRRRNQPVMLYLEVEDHGPGISDQEKSQIFTRFYRTDKSRSSKSHFGLGLSIAAELTELHNGSLFVKDTVGGGATFVLSFPAAPME